MNVYIHGWYTCLCQFLAKTNMVIRNGCVFTSRCLCQCLPCRPGKPRPSPRTSAHSWQQWMQSKKTCHEKGLMMVVSKVKVRFTQEPWLHATWVDAKIFQFKKDSLILVYLCKVHVTYPLPLRSSHIFLRVKVRGNSFCYKMPTFHLIFVSFFLW